MVTSSKSVLLLIVAAASILRLYGLAHDPVALNQDEAVNGYDAYSLGLTLRDHHGNLLPVALQSFGDWASPLLTYITVPFVRLFGLSTWSIRLPVALFGIASVPLLYVLVRKLFGRTTSRSSPQDCWRSLPGASSRRAKRFRRTSFHSSPSSSY